MQCDACHSEWDEQYSKPLDHKVEADGKCSYCGQQIEFRGSVKGTVSS